MNLSIRQANVSGDWSPLLSALPGWRLTSPGVWTEGTSTVRCEPGLGEGFPRFSLTGPSETGRSARGDVRTVRTPAGIGIDLIEQSSIDCESESPILMNHVAVHVPELDPERRWYEALLGRCTVLERERAWEPVTEAFHADAHLFRSPNFYITLRGGFERAFVDHIGWMVDTPDRVDFIAGILRRIEWPIVFGPDEIDGSYLVHFRAPDGRVHDFFYPTACVRIESQ